MSERLVFFVPGVPRPKGSMKSFLPKGARFPITTNSSDRVKPWQATVALAAQAAGVRPREGPVAVGIVLFFARPKGHFGSGRNAGVLKPGAPRFPIAHNLGDGDKHVRAIFDALTGVAYFDDSQACDHGARKRYADGPFMPGALIRIEAPEDDANPEHPLYREMLLAFVEATVRA